MITSYVLGYLKLVLLLNKIQWVLAAGKCANFHLVRSAACFKYRAYMLK